MKARINNKEDLVIEKEELLNGLPVYLNVYHISGVNYFFQLFGVGIFHTGLEIKDLEYSFGSTSRDVTGVIGIRPGGLGFTRKERIFLGFTPYSYEDVKNMALLISHVWRGRTYEPFIKNCNNFTKFFAEVLVRNPVNFPTYINRFSNLKFLFKCMYDPFRNLVGDIVQMSNSESKSSNKKSSDNDETKEKKEAFKAEVKKDPIQEPQKKLDDNRITSEVKKSSENKSSETESSEEEEDKIVGLKNRRIRKRILRSLIQNRKKRYKKIFKNTENSQEKIMVNTRETIKMTHNDFFKKIDTDIFKSINKTYKDKPERSEIAQLNTEQNNEKFCQDIIDVMTNDKINFENYKEMIELINSKREERKIPSQNKINKMWKLLSKHVNNAISNCFEKNNYESALIEYKHCLEIIDQMNSVYSNTSTKSKSSDESHNELKQKEKLNEDSIILDFESKEKNDFSSNEYHLIKKIQLQVLHSVIYCGEKLKLFQEIFECCNKVIEINPNDWIALYKRGLLLYYNEKKDKAIIDINKSYDFCPEKYKEQLKKSLESIKIEL